MSVALFIYACRTDHLPENEIRYNNSNAFQFVELKDIPQVSKFIKNKSGRNDLRLSLRNSAAKSSINQDDINLESSDILKHTTAEGVYYIFNINEIGNDNTIYTLEAKENNGGIVSAKVIEYASDTNLQDNPSHLAHFSGTVSAYSLDGEKYSSVNYTEGNSNCPPVSGGGYPENPSQPTPPNPPGGTQPSFPWTPNYPGVPTPPSYPLPGGSNDGSGSGSPGGGNTGSCDPNTYVVIESFTYENGDVFEVLENDCGTRYTRTRPLLNSSLESNKTTADCNDDGSGVIVLPHPNTVDPCKKAKASVTAANNVLKNPDVQTKMDAVLRGKTQAPNEWGVAIGQKSNGYEVTNAVEGIPGEGEVSIPVSQLTTPLIGDGHSHAGAAGRPSGGDLYEMLKALLTHTDFKYRYVYGDYFGVPENYALIINDRNAALTFLGQFPRSENYDESTHMIKEGSPLGLEYYKAFYHADEGRSDNSSGEVYDSGAIAMAYILEKYNSGISISKADANSTLKKLIATVQQITVPGNGTVKEGVKVSKCP